MKRTVLSFIAIASMFLLAGSAMAATSVAWTNPADGTSFCLPTTVNPQGQASATGTVGGTGLDLALVLDSSGSMTFSETVNGDTKSRGDWQKDFARRLVADLPAATTSVSIIEFDSDANTVQTLLSLNPATNIDTINNAINSVDESGSTRIGTGIDEASAELTGTNADQTRQQMMVVFSDGATLGDPETNAVSAIAAGVEAIHTVGLPGHSVFTMQDIADGPDNTVGTSDDYGVYTDGNDLQALVNIFSGTGGNLVGIDRVDIELPDGTLLSDVAVDAVGNFQVPAPYWEMLAGVNTFVATAFGDDGSSATATLTLNGADCTQPVPEPTTVLLFGTGLLGMAAFGRKKFMKK